MYDYAEGAHPQILKELGKTNLIQQYGYSDDDYCIEAASLIKKEIGTSDVEVHFVSGGTQANLTVISSALKPYESVIAAKTGHIAIHEAGAIEFTGHRINEIITVDGKLTPELILPVLIEHHDEHMVVPKMVYISNSTELGTIYNKDELQKLNTFCKKNNLYLYLDGARLGAALTAKDQDLSMQDLTKLVDVFYIGGTKNGALLGEAIILINDDLKQKFRYSMKQKGALLAKGRLFGIQFSELFRNGLFYELSKHANDMAYKLVDGIQDLGFSFTAPPATNIIFPIIADEIVTKLEKKYHFYQWEKLKTEYTSIRLVTSWATREDKVDEFINDLGEMI